MGRSALSLSNVEWREMRRSRGAHWYVTMTTNILHIDRDAAPTSSPITPASCAAAGMDLRQHSRMEGRRTDIKRFLRARRLYYMMSKFYNPLSHG